MSYSKVNRGGARNFKHFLSRRNLTLILSGILIYCLIIVGSTYAYLYANNTNTNALTGNLGTADIDLSVERIVPTTTKPLVPLKDTALSKALKGTGGISSCIDANNNLSCEVYKITIENTGSTNLQLNSTIALVAKETGTFQNLKWRELTNPTTIKEDSAIKPMAQSILEGSFLLGSGASRTYYIAVWISETNSNQLTNDTGGYGGIVRVTSVLGEGVTAKFGDTPEIGATYLADLYDEGDEILEVEIGSGLTNVSNNVTNHASIINLNKIKNSKTILMDTTTTSNKVYLNTTKGIMLDNNGEYRYYGANPNNYVSFNNELWRIISVSNVKSSLTDTTGEERIRLISDQAVVNEAWNIEIDEYGYEHIGNNNWAESSLMCTLNTAYLNYTIEECQNKFFYNSYDVALDSTAISLIDNALWYVGAIDSESLYAHDYYNLERGNNASIEGIPTKWVGKIGTMYPSDYMYATDLSLCTYPGGFSSPNYQDPNCSSNDWLYFSGEMQWTISPSETFSTRAFMIFMGSPTSGPGNTDYYWETRPVVVLKSDVIITGGTGTSTDPYTLA